MSKKLSETPADKLAGLTVDLMTKIRKEVISIEELENFLTMKTSKRREFFGILTPKKQLKKQFLKLISGRKSIIIEACDGAQTIADAKDVFPLFIDPDFTRWGLDNPSTPTEQTPIKVYELVKDAKLIEMLDSLETDLDKLCLTQHQIKTFCKKHSNWLNSNGKENFFLFKENEKFFVARVVCSLDGLMSVHVSNIKENYIFSDEYKYRFVLPK
jgi:hypothetical protein